MPSRDPYERLVAIGFHDSIATELVEHVDINQIEALVYARGCPIITAALIASYDDMPAELFEWRPKHSVA